MDSSNYRFTLDMQSEQSQVSLPVRLNDTDRRLYISLTNGGKPYYIEDGCLALFVGIKPDGKDLGNHCIIENNSIIRYDFTEQTANVAGIINCEIRLFDAEGNLVTSPRFIMIVDSRVVNNDVTISESEHSIIDEIAQAELARVSAEASRVSAENQRVEAEESRAYAEATRAYDFDQQMTSVSQYMSEWYQQEQDREEAEALRIEAEKARVASETARAESESNREMAEAQREANETTRIMNEEVRVSQEDTRKANEDTRIEAEAIREANAQLYGNAFRTSVSGQAIRVDDVSPLVQDVKCKVDDIDNVTVSRCGKNLWSGGDIEVTEGHKIISLPCTLPPSTYTLTADIESTDTDSTNCLVYDATNQTPLAWINRGEKQSVVFTLSGNCNNIALYASSSNANGEGDTATYKNVQLELGSEATDFEEYKEVTTHTPNADGTVEGIKSIAPTMTILTDTANVVIEIEYNQDVNTIADDVNELLDLIVGGD